MVEIFEATEVTDELVEAMARLVPQLSSSNQPPSAAELQEIIDSDAVRLLIARDQRGVIGTLTLVLFRIPTGIRAWIEDVIVDEGARGSGIGRSLNEAAIEQCPRRWSRDHRSDLSPFKRRRQPPLPTAGIHTARNQRLSLHPVDARDCFSQIWSMACRVPRTPRLISTG